MKYGNLQLIILKPKQNINAKRFHFLKRNQKIWSKKLNNEEQNYNKNTFKEELNDIYEEISNGIKIKSRCNWYELGEKPNKYFLNLEKSRACEEELNSPIFQLFTRIQTIKVPLYIVTSSNY